MSSTRPLFFRLTSSDQGRLKMTEEVRKGVIKMVKENTEPYAPEGKSCLSREYEILNEIGRGNFGIVHRANSRSSGRQVAIKVVSPWQYNADNSSTSSARKDNFLDDFQRTLQEAVLQSDVLDHPNVVKVHDKWIQYETSKSGLTPEQMIEIVECKSKPKPELLEALDATKDLKFCLCMELYDGNLENWLQDKDELKNDDIINKLAEDIFSGVLHVHEKEYAHGDLTLRNILYKKGNDELVMAALTDFGWASKITSDSVKVEDDEFVYSVIPETAEEQHKFLSEIYSKLQACISNN